MFRVHKIRHGVNLMKQKTISRHLPNTMNAPVEEQ